MTDQAPALKALLEHNHKRLEDFLAHPFMQLFDSGQLEDPRKREVFLAAIQRFSTNFQAIILTRQAFCTDPRFRSSFREHFSEEINHDELLADREGSREIDDAVIIAITAWFPYQMVVLDNVEKAALVHLVLEEVGDHLLSAASRTVGKYVKSGYFETHAELDEGHAAMGVKMLEGQDQKTYERLTTIVDLGWEMMFAAAERVVLLLAQIDDGSPAEKCA